MPDEDEEAPGDDDPPDTRVLTAKAGLNRHAWDLRYPGMDRFERLILWNDMKEGPLAVPGPYRARLTVGDVVREQAFEVKLDPRASASPADYLAQFEFVAECRDLLSRTHREIVRIREFRAQLETLKSRFEEVAADESSTALLAEIATIDGQITAIEEALYQTNNESRQDPLNFPIRLNDKLTGVMSLVASSDAPPTTQALVVKAELSAAIARELDALQAVWDTRLPALNDSIRALDVEFVTLSGDAE
jgi:hypothetical protein